jgi:hypothetical protein
MKDAATCALLLLLVGVALVVQELIPPMEAYAGARLLFVPMLVVYASLSLPFPYMLLVAFLSGWGLDLMQIHFVDNRPEIAVGTTIFYFLAIGSICQGLRILFLRGYWWLFSLMSGISTSALLALQFLLVSFRRFEEGGLEWNSIAAWRIFLPGVVVALLAPFLQGAGFLLSGWLFPTERRRRAY